MEYKKKKSSISEKDIEASQKFVKEEAIKRALERSRKEKAMKPKEKIISRFKKHILDEED